MAGRNARLSDLEGLAKKVVHPGEPGTPAGAEPAAEDAGLLAEARAVLEDLKRIAEDGASEARQAAEDHPLATVAAAFLLGLLVGRLWRVSGTPRATSGTPGC